MNLFASEWIKARSVRSTWLLAAATIVVTTVVSLLGISGLSADWQTELPADFDSVGVSFKGILVGQLLMAMLGAQAVTSEYASGQIISTLAIAPRRARLFAAKALVAISVAAVVAVATVAASFAAGQAALAVAGLPTATMSDGETVRALLCAIAYLVLSAVLGLAFGILTRSSSGALAIVVTVSLLVPALAPGLPGVVGQFAGTFWPTTAGQASYTVVGSGVPPLLGLAVMAVFTVWMTAAAVTTLRVRDA
ncbi:ABC transporter permease [Microbacterium binotii]|uniref:ABC transporter permease n=1 Tax=Microbacterium binotii TaxID=462710 RepID=UPI001F23B421|nr:ABC transporter permease [Microbacterium binotii]UIN29542.1 ABC transporter permease [Microbacterium binotii]